MLTPRVEVCFEGGEAPGEFVVGVSQGGFRVDIQVSREVGQ